VPADEVGNAGGDRRVPVRTGRFGPELFNPQHRDLFADLVANRQAVYRKPAFRLLLDLDCPV